MKVKRLVTCAALAALCFVLSLFSIDLGSMKFTLDALPILVASMLFGAPDGIIVGTVGSFMNQLLKYGLGATTALWVLPAAVRGLVVGLYARRRGFSLSYGQTGLITVLSALLVTAINTGVMWVDARVYGYPFAATIPTVIIRIAAGVITSVIFTAILPTLLTAIRKVLAKSGTAKPVKADTQR